MKLLSKEQVVSLQDKLIDTTGGIHGIRDDNLLDSALNNPFQTFDNEDLYPSMISKIARLVFNIISNHPFVDGNKRIGMLVLLITLELNQIEIEFSDEDVIKIGLEIAMNRMTDSDLAAWILKNSN